MAFAALLLVAPAARAEDDDIDDAQIWTSYQASGPIRGDLSGTFDMAARLTDTASRLGHMHVRAALGWQVRPGVVLGGGYAYVRTRSLAGGVANEHRIFQQAFYPLARMGKISLTGRTRLEQRLFEGVDGTAWRLRQQIRATLPLAGAEGLRAVVHTEAFFLLNSPPASAPGGFNQIRTFAGLAVPLFGQTGMEAGYLNQTLFPGKNRHNHALGIGFVSAF